MLAYRYVKKRKRVMIIHAQIIASASIHEQSKLYANKQQAQITIIPHKSYIQLMNNKFILSVLKFILEVLSSQ